MGSSAETLVRSELSARERWERVVREDPARAKRFGPPSWLVQEKCRKADKSDFTETAVRLRDAIIVPREELGTGEFVPTGPEYERLLAAQKAKLSPNVPKKSDVPSEMSPTVEYVPKRDTQTFAPKCVACHDSGPEAGRNICAACRKRAWRKR